MQQETLNTILQAIGWIGLIVLCPFLYRFSKAFTQFLINKRYPIQTLYIEYKHDGVVIKRIKIKLDNKDPIVNQLNADKKSEVNFDAR